jgi:hypothetical protein
MAHLKDEDMARLIEGRVNKRERADFLKHLSQCDACLDTYTETLKFVEGEKQREKAEVTLAPIKRTAPRFWKYALPAAAAALLIILVLLPYLSVDNARIKYVKRSAAEIEHFIDNAFVSPPNREYAAVRAGILIEDLGLLVQAPGQREWTGKIVRMLAKNLDIQLPAVGQENFKMVLESIRQLLERESLAELFQLGRFIEYTILSTFEGEMPKPVDIGKFLAIAQTHDLPPGVVKGLQGLEMAGGIEESRRICVSIKEVFFQ